MRCVCVCLCVENTEVIFFFLGSWFMSCSTQGAATYYLEVESSESAYSAPKFDQRNCTLSTIKYSSWAGSLWQWNKWNPWLIKATATEVWCIAILYNMICNTTISFLDLSFNHIVNIDGLEGLLQLNKLFLIQNKITTIKNLHTLTNLTTLELGSNRIRVRSETIVLFIDWLAVCVVTTDNTRTGFFVKIRKLISWKKQDIKTGGLCYSALCFLLSYEKKKRFDQEFRELEVFKTLEHSEQQDHTNWRTWLSSSVGGDIYKS